MIDVSPKKASADGGSQEASTDLTAMLHDPLLTHSVHPTAVAMVLWSRRWGSQLAIAPLTLLGVLCSLPLGLPALYASIPIGVLGFSLATVALSVAAGEGEDGPGAWAHFQKGGSQAKPLMLLVPVAALLGASGVPSIIGVLLSLGSGLSLWMWMLLAAPAYILEEGGFFLVSRSVVRSLFWRPPPQQRVRVWQMEGIGTVALAVLSFLLLPLSLFYPGSHPVLSFFRFVLTPIFSVFILQLFFGITTVGYVSRRLTQTGHSPLTGTPVPTSLPPD